MLMLPWRDVQAGAATGGGAHGNSADGWARGSGLSTGFCLGKVLEVCFESAVYLCARGSIVRTDSCDR
jgi:hypothetical protein